MRRTADLLATVGAGVAGAAVALLAAGASLVVVAPALVGIGTFAFVMQARES